MERDWDFVKELAEDAMYSFDRLTPEQRALMHENAPYLSAREIRIRDDIPSLIEQRRRNRIVEYYGSDHPELS
jgi:hypothetical protein